MIFAIAFGVPAVVAVIYFLSRPANTTVDAIPPLSSNTAFTRSIFSSATGPATLDNMDEKLSDDAEECLPYSYLWTEAA